MFTPLRRTDPDYFEFFWHRHFIPERESDVDYTTSVVVRPPVPMGYYLECTTPGRTGARVPAIPSVSGATVIDGSVVWTVRAPSAVTLPTITNVTYTITPSGIVQSASAITGSKTRVKLDASAAGVGMYTIVAEATAGGEDYSMSTTLEVVD